MAGYSRDSRFRSSRATTRGYGRDSVEYVPVGLPPRSLLDQLVVDMQNHLEEMEKMRVVLVDAYPCLSSWGSGGGRKTRGWKLDGKEDDDDDGTSNYRFCLDVAGFAPEELGVKVEGRKLTVSAKHDKKTEGADGCVSHEYREVRKEILLPGDANLEALVCNFSPEVGRLRIEAPRLALQSTEERTIPITICREPDSVGPSLPPGKETTPATTPEKRAAV
ncbi:heat shock protein 30C-like [Rhineura floridana]|uniref:heat shock protein 30C-like n=1 Tax=Rhineura floridana TaxID=261503 RepID=UPI002AC81BDE|nr:heat shock protein 30C-like [Rhineura floridana]